MEREADATEGYGKFNSPHATNTGRTLLSEKYGVLAGVGGNTRFTTAE
jgi:hypothetical protein